MINSLYIEFTLNGGEVHDCKIAPDFIAILPSAEHTIADRGYDKEELRVMIRNRSSTPLIPRKSNSTVGNDDIDWHLYKYRHLVENLFARLKHFRSITTRYDKLARNYASVIAMAGAYLLL